MYGKLFAQMFDGTLATRGPWMALVTFQQFIILADKNGIVDMTAEAIARRTTIPLDIITAGISKLLEPDPESRSPDEEGRRIVPVSDGRAWGWRIVNYEHYRRIRSEEERREYHRQYMRKRRGTVKSYVKVSTDGDQCSPIAVSSKQYAIKNKDTVGRKKLPLPNDFSISDRVTKWAEERGILNLDAHFENFVGAAKAKGYTYASWDDALMNAVRHDWAKIGDGRKRVAQ